MGRTLLIGHSDLRSGATRGATMRAMIIRVAIGAFTLLSLNLANAAPPAEIRVTLFEQPCVLQGPVDQKTLKTIHSLSPEQMYPQRGSQLASDSTRRALEKLRAISVPSALDRYRERLIRRFEAQLNLLEAIESYRKTRKSAPTLAVGKKLITAKRYKEFEALVKKAEAVKDLESERGREALDAVFDHFSDAVETDPEEEFHRAIHRMNVQYTCSFEESGGEGSEEDETETGKTRGKGP